MKGIISRGLSTATHTPRRDMTLVCSSDNIVDTSFTSCSTSILEKSAEKMYCLVDLINPGMSMEIDKPEWKVE